MIAAVSYLLADRQEALTKNQGWSWLQYARAMFVVHVVAILAVVVALFIIIYFHYYEYYYAWSHSSNMLPVKYMISCFWEGQEGSFLLWMFWHAILGMILIFTTQRKWEAPVMAVFSAVQAFLASMILGVVVFGDFKIGSSPFILLREYMPDAPIFASNPLYIPEDGTGLNPLLQNYWMVIHPPTLFLGFATTLVPFAFCIAGIWKKEDKEWIKPTLPWAHFSALVLGVGILMGGYWAYETLNFGGYWNWDPVENAVYVPWLILVAAIHSMIVFRKNSTALRSSVLYTMGTFLLILYSTFLTRSGILGNASVHSFTDLGLSGQLLIYLLFFVAVSVYFLVLFFIRNPTNQSSFNILSKEFWILMGTLALMLAAFQVIVTTSIPVYNSLLQSIGLESNLALPADQIAHYSKFQLWFAVAIALLSAVGPYFYWYNLDKDSVKQKFYTPLLVSMLATSGVILLAKVQRADYITMLFAGIFSITSNGLLFANLIRKNSKVIAGTLAHIGLAVMLIGILFSAGYSTVVSKNTSGLLYSKEFSTEMNQENVLLFRNDTIRMADYKLLYLGPRVEAVELNGFLDKELLRRTDNPYKAVANKNFLSSQNEQVKKGDTLTVMPENTYYEIKAYKDGSEFVLFPRAQVNKEMGLLASPDIRKMPDRDLYAHVSSIPDPNEDREWSKPTVMKVRINDTILLNDYYAYVRSAARVDEIEGISLSNTDAAVKLEIVVWAKNQEFLLEPVFIIHNGMIGRVSDTNFGLGIRVTLTNIDPTTGVFELTTQQSQRDWVILKAMEKPGINLLWIGAIMVFIGFGLGARRRYIEHYKTS